MHLKNYAQLLRSTKGSERLTNFAITSMQMVFQTIHTKTWCFGKQCSWTKVKPRLILSSIAGDIITWGKKEKFLVGLLLCSEGKVPYEHLSVAKSPTIKCKFLEKKFGNIWTFIQRFSSARRFHCNVATHKYKPLMSYRWKIYIINFHKI